MATRKNEITIKFIDPTNKIVKYDYQGTTRQTDSLKRLLDRCVEKNVSIGMTTAVARWLGEHPKLDALVETAELTITSQVPGFDWDQVPMLNETQISILSQYSPKDVFDTEIQNSLMDGEEFDYYSMRYLCSWANTHVYGPNAL